MKSQTTLICMFMLSLFALHQCARMDVGEIEKSNNKIILGMCLHRACHSWFTKDCFCCLRDIKKCWKEMAQCESNCPPLKY
ncbi:unnamed protein product [Thlaspi arvense]|uniref:Embryo surrounding factor 1 brassicaceae domain-containing protein n=1 Tax=Thlaspi arvense TaxID=13288 RepID=A0AAU9SD09_THLAR|nr:unnamed protein product [Thlaspi arvense]